MMKIPCYYYYDNFSATLKENAMKKSEEGFAYWEGEVALSPGKLR
jgi:hypothetical protein